MEEGIVLTSEMNGSPTTEEVGDEVVKIIQANYRR